MKPRTVILLLHCPLHAGIAARLTEFVYSSGGRILSHEQYVDSEIHHYFTRLEWDVSGSSGSDEEIREGLRAIIPSDSDAEWSLASSGDVPRMAIFASKDPACLYDLLARCRSGEWALEVPLVVGNHPELAGAAGRFGAEFHAFTIADENRADVEARQLELLRARRIDFVVLARYMQVLSGEFVRAYPNRILNIHHGFLPAFPGGRPYHSARERGVKIVGATCHYVTEELDSGPIIDQDVLRVGHRHSVEDLVRLGRDVEKVVLARAVRCHFQHRVIVHRGRTVVFD